MMVSVSPSRSASFVPSSIAASPGPEKSVAQMIRMAAARCKPETAHGATAPLASARGRRANLARLAARARPLRLLPPGPEAGSKSARQSGGGVADAGEHVPSVGLDSGLFAHVRG